MRRGFYRKFRRYEPAAAAAKLQLLEPPRPLQGILIFRELSIILLLPSVLAAAELPATRPTTVPENPAYWLDRALREAADVEDPVLRAEAYAKAAVLMARLGDLPQYKRTIALAEEALAAAPTTPKQSPVSHAVDLATAPVLVAMVLEGDVAGAKAYAEERARINKYSYPGYYAIIAGAQARAEDLKGGLATADELNEYDRRRALKEIASALATRKEFAEAERVAAMMGEKDMERRDALRAIAAARARAGQHDAALAMAEQLPYAHDKQMIYNYVLDAQIDAGDWDAAHATAAAMPLGEKLSYPHKPPEYARTVAYFNIAWARLKRKDIAGARETAVHLDGDQKAQLESAIAKAYIEDGNVAAAREAAEAISRDARGSFSTPPWVEANEALATALAKAGEIDEAVEVARALPQPAETLLNVAGIAVAQGEHEQAREIAEEMKTKLKEGKLLSDFLMNPDRERIRITIAALEKRLGDAGPFERVVAELEERAMQENNSEAKKMATVQLFAIYIAKDDFESAQRLAPSLPKDTLSLLISFTADAAARSGQVERAKSLANLLPTAEDRAWVLQAVLANDPKAPTTPAEIADQISRLPSAYDRSRAYLARAEALWIEGQPTAPAPATTQKTNQ